MHHGPDPSSRPTPLAAAPPAAPTGTIQVTGASVLGVAARSVAVRFIASGGLPAVTFKGLGETFPQTIRDRVRAAVANAGHAWPDTRITIILSPTELPKRGGMLDLPIALGILAVGDAFPPAGLERLWAVGELGPDGTLRPTPGVLPTIIAACEAGARTILVPAANLPEAVHAPHDTSVLGASSLADAIAWLRGNRSRLHVPNRQPDTSTPAPGPDLAELHVGPRVRRALEIAAAGGHSLLLVGPHGEGDLLARCLPSLLPDLTPDEALEVARIRSAAGTHDPHPVIRRPFRVPGHAIAPQAFTGGGPQVLPGELSLAHHGVLFLDQPGNYPPGLLTTLQQPLATGRVKVRYGRNTLRLPARFLLVAATTHSADLPDRLTDLAVQTPPRATGGQPPGTSSAVARGRVTAARGRQLDRGQTLNAHLPVKALLDQFPRTGQTWRTATAAVNATPGLTIEHLHRLLRVARTIADLDAHRNVSAAHITEAASFLPGLGVRATAQEAGSPDQPQP